MSTNEGTYGAPATRQRILQATWELLEEKGAAVRLADTALRAGVSRQSVYLHFGDRSGLLLALVDHIDRTLGLNDLMGSVLAAPTGAEALELVVRMHSVYAPQIDSVVRVLEAAQFDDDALGAAWRDRRVARRDLHRSVIARIAGEGKLAPSWTVDLAADLSYASTLPELWRELTLERGWSAAQYAERIALMLQSTLISENA